MDKIKKVLENIAGVLELILAISIGVGVLIGFIHVFSYLVNFYNANIDLSYNIFNDFLTYILLLVIGIEFILMLLTPSIEKITELVVFVIARKLLIYGSTMLDMVLGSLAIAIVFATLKYLTTNNDDEKNKEIE